MKLNTTLLTLLILIFSMGKAIGQDNIDKTFTERMSEIVTSITADNTLSIESVSFGSYLENETSNTLVVQPKKAISYTRAELISKTTNKTVVDNKLIGGKNKIDLNGIQPDTYMLILTNDKGDISVEEIIII